MAGPASASNADPFFLQVKEKFLDFLKQDEDEGIYAKKVQLMLENENRRLVISINHLRVFDTRLATSLLDEPTKVLPAMEAGLREYVDNLPPDELQKFQAVDAEEQLSIAVEGSFGGNLVTPRQLGAAFLKKLVCLEGIVTRCSVVRPKVVLSKHWCPATGKQYSKRYHDATSLEAQPTTSLYPVQDSEGNLLSTEYGLSRYKDHQLAVIQEMPERAPAGQLPVSIDVLLDNDLVDAIKPGDRLHVVGLFRPIPRKGPFYRTVLIANHIRLIDRDAHTPSITRQDIKTIKDLAKDPEIFPKLANSVAPSIYGHLPIKKAILLMLMGGVEKNLQNGTHLRGDVNMLLIGDPSTAKSQLLRFVLNIAPLAINTTGRGSSGVGLTAAVTSDKETGERMLEAGACVLADRGIVCIDEFDKMSDDDRVAIHEVMEQQTVTVSKAGIHTTLNARCSVMAAANPVYGQYNRQKKPTENIGLPDSLLSRFDLLFIVLDNFNPVHDRTISDHVLRMHRYRPVGTDQALLGPQTASEAALYNSYDDDDEEEEQPVYVQINRLLHGDRREGEIFSIPFLKKYLSYAKYRSKPVLLPEAAAYISKAYSDLRCKEDLKTLPVTARTLETMIRLASAHAKCRLSSVTTADDARVALGIMNFALYHEAEPEDEQPAQQAETVAPNKAKKRTRDEYEEADLGPARKKGRRDEEEELPLSDDDVDMGEAQGGSELDSAAGHQAPEEPNEDELELDPERTAAFAKWLIRFMTRGQMERCTVMQILDSVQSDPIAAEKQFSLVEVRLILKHMEAEEQLLFRRDTVHLF